MLQAAVRSLARALGTALAMRWRATCRAWPLRIRAIRPPRRHWHSQNDRKRWARYWSIISTQRVADRRVQPRSGRVQGGTWPPSVQGNVAMHFPDGGLVWRTKPVVDGMLLGCLVACGPCPCGTAGQNATALAHRSYRRRRRDCREPRFGGSARQDWHWRRPRSGADSLDPLGPARGESGQAGDAAIRSTRSEALLASGSSMRYLTPPLVPATSRLHCQALPH